MGVATEASHNTLQVPKTLVSRLSLAQTAGVYDLFTAQGDVFVQILAAYVTIAGGGFTSLSVGTDHTSPKTIVASQPVANIIKDASASLSGTGFILPDGKKIRLTLVGNGNAGEIVLVATVSAVTPGGSLA
jgi:hypothetical protein